MKKSIILFVSAVLLTSCAGERINFPDVTVVGCSLFKLELLDKEGNVRHFQISAYGNLDCDTWKRSERWDVTLVNTENGWLVDKAKALKSLPPEKEGKRK